MLNSLTSASGQRTYDHAIREFVAHCHAERNHQGIGNALIDRSPPQLTVGAIRRRQRIGGILSYYYGAV